MDPWRLLERIASSPSAWRLAFKDEYFDGTFVPNTVGYNQRPSEGYNESAFRRIRRPRIMIELVLSGKLLLESHGGTEIIPAGGMLIMVKPHAAKYRGLPEATKKTFSSLWISTDNPLLVDHFSHVLMMPTAILPEPPQSILENFADLFSILYPSHPRDFGKAMVHSQIFFRDLIASIVRVKKRVTRLMPPEDILLQEFMEGGDTSLTVNTVAERLGFSREHLSRQFHRRHGMSPKTFLTKIRLEKLEKLLSSLPLSLDECARRSGFGSYPMAARAFRQKYKRSMSEWRMKFKSSE